MKKFCRFAPVLALGILPGMAPWLAAQIPSNQADRLEWFRDRGFGLFIHWSVDSQLGTVISHSLAGASDDFSDRQFLPEMKARIQPGRARVRLARSVTFF